MSSIISELTTMLGNQILRTIMSKCFRFFISFFEEIENLSVSDVLLENVFSNNFYYKLNKYKTDQVWLGF